MYLRTKMKSWLTRLLLLASITMPLYAGAKQKAKTKAKAETPLNKAMTPVFDWCRAKYKPILDFGTLKVEKCVVNEKDLCVDMTLSKLMLRLRFREDMIKEIEDSLSAHLPQSMPQYRVRLFVEGQRASYYIPNLYRDSIAIDAERGRAYAKAFPKDSTKKTQRNVVVNASNPYQPTAGLQGRNLAIWASHGYYFEPTENRWMLQRPRLFGIAEDTYTLSIVYPYLAPMLERAGANVFMPRERDHQKNEVIVDNGITNTANYNEKNGRKGKWRSPEKGKGEDTLGFAYPKKIYRSGENPFEMGTYRRTRTRKTATAYAEWIPTIPETGDYAVYVAYKTVKRSNTAAHYTVYHTGGETEFTVDQSKGGGTWIYLGTFNFAKGRHEAMGKVRLTNAAEDKGLVVTADAVRFGGGMGCVERAIPKENSTVPEPYFYTSEKPKYLECGTYWLQMAGFDSTVYASNKSEYKCDFTSRALWVNALGGGGQTMPKEDGKGVPIDMAFALHTDAGIDSAYIGTMSIFLTNNEGKTEYPTGISRMASRDFADIMQTEITKTIKRNYAPNWSDRGLRDESYYEARVPNVPTVLVELLSHQNFEDMRLAHDPQFKEDMARAIYKAMVRFLSEKDGQKAVFQPLKPTHFSALLHGQDSVRLSWREQKDIDPETEDAEAYIIYTAKGKKGFDNGRLVRGTQATLPIDKDVAYRFKVSAVNRGGESRASEILSVCRASNTKGEALIVNAFNRVSPPASYNDSLFGGFLYDEDPGVADIVDLARTGPQSEFDKQEMFVDNDSPGFGSSTGYFEGQAIAGNSWDYPYLHGSALKKNGLSYSSVSDEYFAEDTARLAKKYLMIDYILGLEKETKVGTQKRYKVLGKPERERLKGYLDGGGNLFISGAFIASEMYITQFADNGAGRFASDYLHFMLKRPALQYISRMVSASSRNGFNHSYSFCRDYNSSQYRITSADAIDKQSDGGMVIFKYLDNGLGSIVGYKGEYRTLVSCIPFESITGESDRTEFMRELCDFFGFKKIKAKTTNKTKAKSKTTVNAKVKLPAKTNVKAKVQVKKK